MKTTISLPVSYDRRFSIQLYWVSHGLLLLRSGKTNEHPTRIDILFQDVRWMVLPAWFDGLRVEYGTLADLPLPLTAQIQQEAPYMTIFRLISQDVAHCILAGSVFGSFEDDKGIMENSALLPDVDFRALLLK